MQTDGRVLEGRVSAIQRIKPVAVLRYAFLPGIVPRIKDFARSGFGWLAYLMAYLYACVRLLPGDHPYLLPSNKGRYGIRSVIAEAANRLVIKRGNIDQIVIFFIILLGFVLLVLQFGILLGGFMLHPAFAADIFTTPNPNTDIAFELLDKVFAIPDLFNSQYDPAAIGMPPFNDALHQLIEFYNFAILLVAVVIFLYYMVLVVAETANSGSPFGRRFSQIYAPLRLIMAVGLLVPLNYGLNGAQYITLFAAKMGSSVATNAWILFNQTLTDSMGGGNANPLGGPHQSLVARPQLPDVAQVVQFMSVVDACTYAYETKYENPPYTTANAAERTNIEPYLVWGSADSAPMAGTDYATAIGATMFNGRDIVVRFGHKSAAMYGKYTGNVYPFCGEMTIHVDDMTQIGSQLIQEGYYNLVRDLFGAPALTQFARRAAAIYLTNQPAPETINVADDANPNAEMPVEAFRQARVNEVNERIRTAVFDARDQMIAATDFAIPPELMDRGWAGASIWYNRIAMWNGALFGSVFNVPTPSVMPSAMEKVERQRRMQDENVDASNRYEPLLQQGQPVDLAPGEDQIARMLNAVYKYWRLDNPTAPTDSRGTGNVIMDLMNALFPINSLFQLRYNDDVHPLAQLVGMGKSIVDTAVRNLMIGLAFGAVGGMTEMLQAGMGAPLSFFSNMFIGLTTLGLAIGFILYYVLPFLPFIYFFFAVGSWVKTIFEAMVGVPLWALAHLRIDGNGLPGDAAMNGYFLIFEIFLRPFLILSGLIGGMIVFSAMTRVVHDIFPLLIVNTGGYDSANLFAAVPDPNVSFKGGVLDEFFYSVIYTIIIYSMATASFKLIDQIPDHAMQWLGASIRPFSDDPNRDVVGNLTRYAAIGGMEVTRRGVGALQQGAVLTGNVGGAALQSLQGRTQMRMATQSVRPPTPPGKP